MRPLIGITAFAVGLVVVYNLIPTVFFVFFVVPLLVVAYAWGHITSTRKRRHQEIVDSINNR